MSIILQIVAVIICIAAIFLLFKKMKQKKISEEQAMFWILGVFGMLVLSCFPQLLRIVANVFGIWWDPATLIFFLMIVIILIIFHHTEAITRLESEVKELAMQVVLLKEENEKLEKVIDQVKGENQ